MVSRKMASDAASVLGLALDDTITVEAVRARYRDLAKTLHPDRGGDPAAFVAADRAKCILVLWAERPKPPPVDPAIAADVCPMCEGEGKRTLRRGFHTMTMVCGTCRGAGERLKAEKSDD